MPRITLFIATSLDGYVAAPGDDLGWLFTDADYGYEAFYEGIDCVVMGRRTFDVVRSFGGWPYAGKRSYVFTHRPIDPHDEVTAVEGPPAEVMPRLAAQASGDIWLVGGGELAASFRDASLIDRYVLSVHPVLLGDGVRLFPRALPLEQLRLQEHHAFPNGLVQLTYERVVHRAW